MNEKETLQEKVVVGEALRELQLHQGWKHLAKILSEMYKEAVLTLIDKDSIEARAKIKAIEQITERIELGVSFAKDAAEELKAEKFKEIMPTLE